MREYTPKFVDVCMPTWNSASVLSETLDRLNVSEGASELSIKRIIVVDNVSNDKTVDIIKEKAKKYSWEPIIIQKETSLPRARELAVQKVESSWFIFLDDDVRISKMYLNKLLQCIAPSIGAIQGRKISSKEKPWEWTQRRVYRGGTHATLIRADALHGVSIPQGVKVLEDEYIRRYIESSGYLWIFNHQARFDHESMERHPIGWEQGYIAGKYNLMPFYSIILLIGDSIYNMKNVFYRMMLMFGYIYGYISKDN